MSLRMLVDKADIQTIQHVFLAFLVYQRLKRTFQCENVKAAYFRKSYIRGFWTLFKILRKEKPDVLQTWLHYSDLIGFIIGMVARVPRILWNIRCSDIEPLFRQNVRNRYIVTILSHLSRFPYAVIANSHAGRLTHEALGYTPKQWINIPNGIDTDLFSYNEEARQDMRRSLGIPLDALVVGMVARVDPMKDHATFLQAMERLSKDSSGDFSKDCDNVYCVIAGKGTDTADFPITPPNLKRLGFVSDIPSILSTMDVHVLSSFGKGFPNAVGESMACEIPTLATDVGDSAILLDDPSLVFEKENADQLYKKIKHLLTLTLRERQQRGKNHRQHILDHYSVPVMQKKYEEVYTQCL